MRFNFRIQKFNKTLFIMYSDTQTLEGVTSLLPNGKHIVMWDLERCLKEQAEETLMKVQISHILPDIFLFSDIKRSFRGWCFSQVDFRTLLKILLDTDYVDWLFFYHTVKRRKATLRKPNCNKKDRPPQELVSVLKSYSVPIPKKYESVIYDTGIEKRGRSILLGDK